MNFINHQINFEKCIPSLSYIQESVFSNDTKQVWWVAPCVYWGGKLVSWVMVDKNGFYAPHPENWDEQDDISAIFSWEMIENISFEIEEFEDHAIAILNIEATNGQELTLYEFLSQNKETSSAKHNSFRGSYLVYLNQFLMLIIKISLRVEELLTGIMELAWKDFKVFKTI